KIMLAGSDSEGKDSVDLIRDSLFSIQVEQPWLLLQFGDSNKEEIGAERVDALVSVSPSDDDGETREDVVIKEIETFDNDNLTIPQVMNRLGMVFFLLIFNLGITKFVFLLTGMMIFSQILFIIYAMFLPVSFLLSMIPTYENMAKQAVVRVFNTIMTRAGITLIVTVAFSISSMFYNMSSNYPFFMVAFLQIVTFAGIYMKLGDLMSMFSLNASDSQNMGRRMFRRPMMFVRSRTRRMERRLARAVGAGAGAGAMLSNGSGSPRSGTSTHKRNDTASSSMASRAGSAVGAVLDTKNRVRDRATAVKESVKDMPTQAGYAVYSAKEKAKENMSDFKRGVVQEQKDRQAGRADKRNQHRQNIADKRMAMQKAQEERQSVKKTDGSATAGATRPHERPVTASAKSTERPVASGKPSADTVKQPVVKERPVTGGASVKMPEQKEIVQRPAVKPSEKYPATKEQTTRQTVKNQRTVKGQQTKQVQKKTMPTKGNTPKKGRKP
ncbi:hypothetical protein C3O87_19100, partial [Clostridioides difficile]